MPACCGKATKSVDSSSSGGSSSRTETRTAKRKKTTTVTSPKQRKAKAESKGKASKLSAGSDPTFSASKTRSSDRQSRSGKPWSEILPSKRTRRRDGREALMTAATRRKGSESESHGTSTYGRKSRKKIESKKTLKKGADTSDVADTDDLADFGSLDSRIKYVHSEQPNTHTRRSESCVLSMDGDPDVTPRDEDGGYLPVSDGDSPAGRAPGHDDDVSEPTQDDVRSRVAQYMLRSGVTPERAWEQSLSSTVPCKAGDKSGDDDSRGASDSSRRGWNRSDRPSRHRTRASSKEPRRAYKDRSRSKSGSKSRSRSRSWSPSKSSSKSRSGSSTKSRSKSRSRSRSRSNSDSGNRRRRRR